MTRFLHTVIVDNFFDNPDEIVKYADSLDYDFLSKENWPGGRSMNLCDINTELFNYTTNTVLSYYFNLEKQYVTWGHSNIRFHKILPGDWEKHDRKNTIIHKDTAHIGGVVYLNKDENDEGTGTSFYDDNLNKMYSVNNYYNNAVFFQGNRLNHGASSIDNNKTRLVMVFFMSDIKYKYID